MFGEDTPFPAIPALYAYALFSFPPSVLLPGVWVKGLICVGGVDGAEYVVLFRCGRV